MTSRIIDLIEVDGKHCVPPSEKKPTATTSDSLRDAALWYAELGLRVLPLHDVVAGRCSCGDEPCTKSGKHPRIEDWPNEASSDPVRITEWWSTWPDANVGILTGRASGLVVLDVDRRHGGDKTLQELEASHGALPATWTVQSGGGGTHFFFRCPAGVEVQTSTKRVGNGLDVRAEGGQVAAPPSLHASGARYAWPEGRRPGEIPLADMPQWLLELARRPSSLGKSKLAPPVPEKVEEGSRNSVLTSLAGTMRRRAMSEEAMLAALLEENTRKCDPPLEEEEVRKIAESVARYEPSDPPRVEPTEEDIEEAQETIAEMLEKAKADPGAPFEPDAMRALHTLRQADPAAYERTRATLRELKVGVRRLETEIEKLEPQAQGADVSTEAGLIASFADQIELFHRPDGEGFATFPVGEHQETWPVRSRDFRRWLVRQYYELTKQPPKGQALTDALCLLEARAQFDGEEHDVGVRVAGGREAISIDLVNEVWSGVEVTPGSWKATEALSVRFRRARGMTKLPMPEPGGNLESLRKFVNVPDEDAWRLLVVFLTSALRPKGPYPVLLLHGEQGSAKSTTARVIRAVVDPSSSPLRSEPRDGRDLMIAAANGWVICLDNLSSIPGWLSDSICRLATGGGFATRTLYTDDEEKLFDAQRPVILTGIEELATRADLLERSLVIYLPAIPETKRRREADFWSEFDAEHPAILGALLQAVADALKELPGVQLERLPRMADFATWGVAIEQALRWPAGSFLESYEGNRIAVNELVIEASSLGPVVLEFFEKHRGGWEGTATELLGALTRGVDDAKRRREPWSRSPKNLSDALRRLVPNLRSVGISVRFERKPRRRLIIIEGVGGAASAASFASRSNTEKDLRHDAGRDAEHDAETKGEVDPDTGGGVTQAASRCVTSASLPNSAGDAALTEHDADDAVPLPSQNVARDKGVL